MERIKIFAELTGNPANDVLGTPETYNITTEEFKPLYNQKGVYFLYSSENAPRPIYIGRSVSNAGKTIMRHFQNWDRAKERKMTEDSPKKLRQMYVEFFPMNDADKEDIFLREAQEIDKYKPRENMIKEVRKWKENTNHYIKKTDEMREKEAEYLARQAEREAEAQADKEYISKLEAQQAAWESSKQAQQEEKEKEKEAIRRQQERFNESQRKQAGNFAYKDNFEDAPF